VELWIEEIINKVSDLKLKFLFLVKSAGFILNLEIKSGFVSFLSSKQTSLA
jgi:hypothetical protein